MKNLKQWQATGTTATGVAGVNYVRSMVTEAWKSRWQDISAENDDGVDGLAMIRTTRTVKGRECTADTGVIAFIQVKSGPGYLARITESHVEINLGADYIEGHLPRWAKHPGPAILVYVLEHKAWWVDLRCPELRSPTNKAVLCLPIRSRFGPHSKGHVRRLDSRAGDRELPVIHMTERQLRDASNGHGGFDKESAAKFFKLKKILNLTLGEVQFSRTGWRHTTRNGRSPLRIQQSFSLMPVAARIIREVDRYSHLRTLAKSAEIFVDLVGLRARAEFPHRDVAVVQVVLLRKRYLNEVPIRTAVWFYTVYEPRRQRRGRAGTNSETCASP